MPDAIDVAGGTDKEEIRERVKLLDQLIDWEYAAIDQRTGWVLVLQGFLINAFVSLLTRPENPVFTERKPFLIGIGVFAVLTALMLWVGIRLGHGVIERHMKIREDFENAAKSANIYVPETFANLGTTAHVFGHLATKFIPIMIFFAWIILVWYVATAL